LFRIAANRSRKSRKAGYTSNLSTSKYTLLP